MIFRPVWTIFTLKDEHDEHCERLNNRGDSMTTKANCNETRKTQKLFDLKVISTYVQELSEVYIGAAIISRIIKFAFGAMSAAIAMISFHICIRKSPNLYDWPNYNRSIEL